MLRVEIWVNSRHIGTETAVRIIGSTNPDSINSYRLSDECVIKHRYGDGAAKLAERMMRHLSGTHGGLK